ncbi:MAG: hypothetical protein I8H96_05040 [Sphingomonadaceae bacterium]|nr:hypothetical protein [Sphingomonadaceae bacterium]
MLLLARCLDWICLAFMSGAQDEMRLNDLMLQCCARKAAQHPDEKQPTLN